MALAGISPNPAVLLTDERGNVAILEAIDGHWLEPMEREMAVEFGGNAFASDSQMTVAEARTATARGAVSLAIRIGEAVCTAEHDPRLA